MGHDSHSAERCRAVVRKLEGGAARSAMPTKLKSATESRNPQTHNVKAETSNALASAKSHVIANSYMWIMCVVPHVAKKTKHVSSLTSDSLRSCLDSGESPVSKI